MATAAKHAPWYVVPADNKWFTRLVVAAAIVEAVEELNLHIQRSTRRRRGSWRLRVRSLPSRPHETSAKPRMLVEIALATKMAVQSGPGSQRGKIIEVLWLRPPDPRLG